jgi:hypothetical protein
MNASKSKPKTRKAPAKAAAIDPIFAAIVEHKRLAMECRRLCRDARTARSHAEKKYGDPRLLPDSTEWVGWAIVTPFYDQWNRTDRAARKAGMRMARTKPTTLAGAAALVDYTQRNYTDEDNEDWAEVALKTVAVSLARMNQEAA